MQTLERVHTYLDDLLCIIDDHIETSRQSLTKTKKAKLCVNVKKSIFVLHDIECLGYILTREGVTPQPDKATAMLAPKEPTSVKILRSFLGMVQYYCDIWMKLSHTVVPLTDLIAECGETKTTTIKSTVKKW